MSKPQMSLVLTELFSLWRDAEESDKAEFLAGQWIKCSERMPADLTECIFYGKAIGTKRPRVDCGWFDLHYSAGPRFVSLACDTDHEAIVYKPSNVTHWQPLPEPPHD